MADLLYDDGASRVRPARSRGSTAGSRARASGPGDRLSTQQASMLRWQRQAGNRAVTAAVQRADPEPVEEEKEPGRTQAERGAGAVAPVLGGGRSGAGGPSTFDSNDASPDFGGGGTSAALRLGTLGTEVQKVWTASKKVHQGRKDKKDASDEAARHQAERDLKTGGGDIAEKAASIPGTVTKAGTKIASLTGHTSTAASVTGGSLALPAQVYTAGRSIRQADKARQRWRRLKELSETQFQDPATLLRSAEEYQDTVQQERSEVEDSLRVLALLERTGKLSGEEPPAEELAERAELQVQQADLRTQLKEARQAVREAKADLKTADTLKATIQGRFADATKAPTLAEIVEYAKVKQKRGTIKKAISAVGGSVSVAASAVAIAAAIATAAAFVLTPVGWGVAALAAAVGIGLVGYKGIQRFRKFAAERSKETQAAADASGESVTRKDKLRDFGKNLLDTLNPRKKAPSDRTAYAETLLDYYIEGAPNQRQEAEQAIIALLGIEKSKRRAERLAGMKDAANREKTVKLLAAKLAS